MAAQSMIMGDAFGRSFQYGKRKISAMSNEEFNALDTKSLVSEMTTMYKEITPNLIQMMKDSTELQNQVIAQMLDIPREALSALFGATVPETSRAKTGQTEFERPTTYRPPQPTNPITPTISGQFQNKDCTSVQQQAQKLIDRVTFEYQRYLNATGNDKNRRKVDLTKASSMMNLFIQANTTCLKGWSPR